MTTIENVKYIPCNVIVAPSQASSRGFRLTNPTPFITLSGVGFDAPDEGVDMCDEDDDPPAPGMTLAQVIDYIEKTIDLAERRRMETLTKDRLVKEYHRTLGCDIRNDCRFWAPGTMEMVKDIERIYMKRPIYTVDECNLNFVNDWSNHIGSPSSHSIYHPDNCSAVVIDIYHDLIRGEIGLYLIERQP